MEVSNRKKMVHFAPMELVDVIRLLYSKVCGETVSHAEAMQLLRDSDAVDTMLTKEVVKPTGTIRPYKSMTVPVEFADGDIDVAGFEKTLNDDVASLVIEARDRYEVQLEKMIAFSIQRKKANGALFSDLQEGLIVHSSSSEKGKVLGLNNAIKVFLFMLVLVTPLIDFAATLVKVVQSLPDKTYQCPDRSPYDFYRGHEVYFDSAQSPMALIVPNNVTNIHCASFTGKRLGQSGGSTFYDTISTVGITDVFFTGVRPDLDARWSTYYCLTGYTHQNAGGSLYSRDQFYNCTVWYVEGLVGWTNGTSFCSGIVKPGAARVELYPRSDNGAFSYENQQHVSMTCVNPNATIYYTLDGTEPTTNSLAYSSPVEIEGNVIVRAMAVVPSYPFAIISSQAYEWYVTKTPVVVLSETAFVNVSQSVEMLCATEGADILYTTDGSDPKEHGHFYTHPIEIHKSCTIRIVARKPGWDFSSEASCTLTRVEGLSEATNLYGYLMETNENSPWTVVTDVSRDGNSCVRSGTIGNGGVTWLQTSVRKTGVVSFWWRASCEEADVDDSEYNYYDYGSFFVDDVLKARIAGHDTGWRKVEVDVPTGGKHVLRWEYRKDDTTSYSPDCIWLDQVQWVPSDGSGCTLTTPYPIPYSWLTSHGFGSDSDYETAAKSITGKFDASGRAMSVWQDYVIGTTPTDKKDVLRAMISLEDGVPFVSWTPDLNTNGEIRVYRVFGKKQLTDPIWMYPTNSSHRFFKVKVEMP